MTDTIWTPIAGLHHWAAEQPDAVFLTQPHGGATTDITWSEAADQVHRLAGCIAGLDLPRGSRIALLSRNCAAYFIADLAIGMAGHVSVPIYPSLNAETLRHILAHSEARLLFVGPLDDARSMAAGIPDDLAVVQMPGAAELGSPNRTLAWADVIIGHPAISSPVPREPDELARLVYTSGSTGLPKGVMCSFRSIEAGSRLLGNLADIGPGDRMLSYLPLAHVFEAAAVEANALRNGFRVYFSEGLDTFAADLRRAQPTIFLSVPRLWVKFQQSVLAAVPQERLTELLRDPASADATRRDVLVKLGLQDVRLAITGSAPLAPSVMQWYRDLGLELLEGYAMSEDFAYSHCSYPGRARIGYVGETLPGVERRIAESGEVQIRSPGGMLGYYKDADQTAEAYTADGWFRTGDLGEVDDAGRLRITGRLKEIFKTAKGKYVAPVPIECRLGHPRVEVVCVSGADQPQPFVLMMPSPLASEALGNAEGRAAFEVEIEALLDQVNGTLDPHEQLAFAVVVADAWSIENGLLTPTMKIRRSAIEGRYADRIGAWAARRERVVWERELPLPA
ncbi:AMP-binding protein [Algiphilus sp.]|uniref:AMP-binding protein n=1 Tax=Algiphilus sp. TaxID=1872431 RepID=UPI0025BFFAB4|nr:AMP-binding protein [Algiphilus sp.]MCK5771758.1 AMP-binding protein [Algiphilus sp.]